MSNREEFEKYNDEVQYLASPQEAWDVAYALGVADERARLAKQFDEAGWHPYAEVIRNSNNARMDCDSNIGS
jgi:hypothetical protein